MATFKTNYKFKNGTSVTFIIKNDPKNPIAKCEWSCDYTKKNIEPLINEYVNKCIPFVYQQIADFTGQGILWVDKHLVHPPQRFEPRNLN